MKIAVISDLHGNMEALEAVMEDIKERGCERLFVLGDYAMAGPEPQSVVRYFMDKKDDKNIDMIQGNTDLMIADYSEELYDSMKTKLPVMSEALKNDVQTLTPEEKEFLKNLPPQKEVIIDGVKFLLVHGSPRRNNEDILEDTPLTEVEAMLEGVDADVILCGHTHIPCGFQTTKKQTVVNDGSVGRPFTEEPESCYVIISTLGNGNFEVEHRFVKYDNHQAAKVLSERGFNGADKLANNLIHPSERHF